MKKIFIILVIILFLGFAFLGFEAASKLGTDKSASSVEANDLDLMDTQKNYLLIHINDLANAHEELISAWGLFVVYSEPPQLVFMPLFPVADEARSKSIVAVFNVTDDNKLDSRFIEEVENQYKMTFSGYVAVDNTGLSLFQKWLTGESGQISSGMPATDDEAHLILYNGQEYFKSLCAEINVNGFKPFFYKIRWTQLLPSHFSTNLSFASFTLAEELLKSSGNIEQCNVLSNE